MRTLILILLAATLVDASAQVEAKVGPGRSIRNPIRAGVNITPHNHPATPLLYEDFENPAGYDLAGWATDLNAPGTINPDNTTNVLYGTQSLAVVEAEDDPTMVTNSFTASDHVFVAFRFKPTLLPDTTDSTVFRLNDVDGNCQVRITVNSDSEIRVQIACTGTAFQPATTLSIGTTYTIWLEYDNDNGANSYTSLGISTNGTRPTSGDGFIDGTGTSTATQVSHVQIGKTSAEASQHASFILDHLLIDDVQINDWP